MNKIHQTIGSKTEERKHLRSYDIFQHYIKLNLVHLFRSFKSTADKKDEFKTMYFLNAVKKPKSNRL